MPGGRVWDRWKGRHIGWKRKAKKMETGPMRRNPGIAAGCVQHALLGRNQWTAGGPRVSDAPIILHILAKPGSRQMQTIDIPQLARTPPIPCSNPSWTAAPQRAAPVPSCMPAPGEPCSSPSMARPRAALTDSSLCSSCAHCSVTRSPVRCSAAWPSCLARSSAACSCARGRAGMSHHSSRSGSTEAVPAAHGGRHARTAGSRAHEEQHVAFAATCSPLASSHPATRSAPPGSKASTCCCSMAASCSTRSTCTARRSASYSALFLACRWLQGWDWLAGHSGPGYELPDRPAGQLPSAHQQGTVGSMARAPAAPAARRRRESAAPVGLLHQRLRPPLGVHHLGAHLIQALGQRSCLLGEVAAGQDGYRGQLLCQGQAQQRITWHDRLWQLPRSTASGYPRQPRQGRTPRPHSPCPPSPRGWRPGTAPPLPPPPPAPAHWPPAPARRTDRPFHMPSPARSPRPAVEVGRVGVSEGACGWGGWLRGWVEGLQGRKGKGTDCLVFHDAGRAGWLVPASQTVASPAPDPPLPARRTWMGPQAWL